MDWMFGFGVSFLCRVLDTIVVPGLQWGWCRKLAPQMSSFGRLVKCSTECSKQKCFNYQQGKVCTLGRLKPIALRTTVHDGLLTLTKSSLVRTSCLFISSLVLKKKVQQTVKRRFNSHWITALRQQLSLPKLLPKRQIQIWAKPKTKFDFKDAWEELGFVEEPLFMKSSCSFRFCRFSTMLAWLLSWNSLLQNLLHRMNLQQNCWYTLMRC